MMRACEKGERDAKRGESRVAERGARRGRHERHKYRALNRARASRKRPRGGGERTNEGDVRSAFNIARAA